MPAKWFEGKVVRIEQQSPSTRRFWLEVDQSQGEIAYTAGQFVTMDLPVGEKRLQRWRSYSIANAPDGSNCLEFCIVKLEGGLATTYLFDQVQPGHIIKCKQPDGGFVMPEVLDTDLVMICTGTGVAPFRAMLQDIVRRQKVHKSIHLIFGTRYADGILYREEFESLQQSLPGFRYSVALSREKNIDPQQFSFPVYAGYVHDIYTRDYPEKRDDIKFYLCGWTAMIDEAVGNLAGNMGYNKSQLVYELYG